MGNAPDEEEYSLPRAFMYGFDYLSIGKQAIF